MKKKLCLVFLYLLCHSLQGQMLVNRSYHAVNEVPGSFLVNIFGDLYFTTEERSNPALFGMCRLYKHGPSGNLKFIKQPFPLNRAMIGFETNDHKLAVAGMNTICDVMIAQRNFLAKIDTSGQAVFTSTYAVSNGDWPTACVQLMDSTYYSFTDSLVFKHSKTGQLLSKTNLNLTSISSALVLQNNDILISAKSGGVNYLITMSPSMSPGQMIMTPVLMKKLSFYGAQNIVAAGTDGNLYKYTPGLGFISSSAFGNGLTVGDFVCQNDTVYSILSASSAWSNYAMADTSFAILNLSSTTTHSFFQNAIAMSGQNVAILGTGSAKQQVLWPNPLHQFASLSIMGKTSDNNFTNDIAVTFVDADSAYMAQSTMPYPRLRARVTIKNVGVRPVLKFKLNCIEFPAVSCGTFFYQEEFSGFTLYQGDSITVTTGRFVDKGYGSINSEFCFYTTLPNGETDKTLEDNELCVNFGVIASLRDHTKTAPVLHIFPNPFENELSIESDSRITSVEIVNALGMLVYKAVVNDKTFSMHNDQLPAGMYMVKVSTDKGTVIEKLIRQ